MQANQKVAVWIHDEAAKLFLGLRGKRAPSRWAVVGTVLPDMDSPIGIWIDIEHVEERRTGTKGKLTKVAWTIHPGQCLIRWDFIITAQVVAGPSQAVNPRPAPGFV